MPCNICKSLRIFDSEGSIVCPKCLDYKFIDNDLKISQFEKDIVRIRKSVKKKLKKLNLDKLKYSLIREREEIAYKILLNIRDNHVLLEDWFMHNLFISIIFSLENSKIDFPKEQNVNTINLEILYNQINTICKLKHSVSLLKFKKIIYIQQENGEEKAYKTEKAPITALPSGFKSDKIDIKEFEYSIFQNYLSHELEDLIKSELYSHYLKSYYNERILPFLNPNTTRQFYFMLKYIIDNFIYIGLPIPTTTKGGLNSIVEIAEFRTFLKKKFSEREIENFFHNMILRDSSMPSLFNFFYYNNISNEVIISYNSLHILFISVYSHLDLPKKGEESNIKGKSIEELIHAELHVYNMNLYHPRDNFPLVGVKLKDEKFGDIDILGFNDEYVVLIESKFWYMPTLQVLEPEIEKFFKRCRYAEDNLGQFGILKSKDKLKFIKILYTPFAPFSQYKDIMIFPTRFGIYTYLNKHFSMRKSKTPSHTKEIGDILKKTSGRHPYLIDLNQLDNKLPCNKYRLQDARIHEYNGNRIVLSIFNPKGHEHCIFCDIDNQVYEFLIASNIQKGDFIKCILFNQLGFWNRIKLLFFKPVEYNELYVQLLNLYRTTENIDVIYQVFKRNNFNLEKLAKHCIKKNQLIFQAIGHILAANIDMQFVGGQCDCGEIMHYLPEIYNKLVNLDPNRKIKCKYCDPSYLEKIEMITKKKMYDFSIKRITELDYKELLFNSKKI